MKLFRLNNKVQTYVIITGYMTRVRLGYNRDGIKQQRAGTALLIAEISGETTSTQWINIITVWSDKL
jgi:hypothetical protein